MYYQLVFVDESERAMPRKITTFCDMESFDKECESISDNPEADTVLVYVGENPISNLICGKTAEELSAIMVFEHSGLEAIVKTIETTLTDREKEELIRLLLEEMHENAKCAISDKVFS